MSWETCRIGSCHRHQKCMYGPCRNEDRFDGRYLGAPHPMVAVSREELAERFKANDERLDRNQPWRHP